ncbi:MAG: hypothetical protein QOE90_3041 [Thermoplasmata archaeon]|jgi:hypothetical protein|nr:hypothetical protein [Thermoplasmata archaeon]
MRQVRFLLRCGFAPSVYRDEWGHVVEVSLYCERTRTGASWMKGNVPRRELEALARYATLATKVRTRRKWPDVSLAP